MTLLDGWTSLLGVSMLMGLLNAISSWNPNHNVRLTLKTKERAHIIGMRWVGMRSKDKNKEDMRQTVQGIWDQVSLE
jgi:hypothetical protein